MEYLKAPTSNITMIDASNNNNSHNHNQKKKRTGKRRQSPLHSLTSENHHVIPVIITDSNCNSQKIDAYDQQEEEKEHIPMKNPLAWTKKWTKWFSLCGSERVSHSDLNPITVPREKGTRTKSENDVSKRGSGEQEEKKKLSTTSSSFAIGQNFNENQERRLSQRSSQQQYHQHLHRSNEKVNNSNTVVYRDTTRRYSNSFFSSARCGGRTSISAIPLPTTTTTTTHTSQQKQPLYLSRSVDRLHKKVSRRELRYEEHDDDIPSPTPLYSIQCHPTIDHHTKTLNQPTYFSSNRRQSQIEAYQLLSRPYSTNIPFSHSVQIMSKTSSDNNTYGKLSECHSPLIPLENSSIKAPRRIESAYSQFPIQEPVYANTQSLYDNILYPQSTSKFSNRTNEQEKKSCASQTQLTWTMATFSSFVDLENQSAIIPQPDPDTLYSIVQHYHPEPPPSASPETIEQMKKTSPRLQYIDDTNPSSHYQRPRSPISSNLITVEKRDSSFQTILSIAPTQDIESNKQLFIHDSTPSPISTGSSTTTGQQQQQHRHHHHHHHRKHKSHHNTSNNNISTRDVGLQVNIQTVKRITLSSQKSGDESSLTTTTPSSPPTMKPLRELKNVETNTEPVTTKHDTSTSYESSIRLVTSSSQTIDSSPTTIITNINRQTKAAQTPNKTLRDQAIETNNDGLFLCDLSSLLKNGFDEPASLTTKRKS